MNKIKNILSRIKHPDLKTAITSGLCILAVVGIIAIILTLYNYGLSALITQIL